MNSVPPNKSVYLLNGGILKVVPEPN